MSSSGYVNAWASVRGANYVPSYARNSAGTWEERSVGAWGRAKLAELVRLAAAADGDSHNPTGNGDAAPHRESLRDL